MTGLLNRNAFDDDVEFIQATHDKPLTVMYIDLIGLHEINNHLGHARGDVVLCELADAARAYFGDDNIYRIGGDEFVIISFAHSMAQSARQMGYMRQELLDHGCELSVGMAESDDGEDIPDLVNQAENEMRKDKKRYYASGSDKRQLRTLNKQLEDILVRNKDMESLLQHLNTRYSIAYVVNLRADTQRPVVVPGYVQKCLTNMAVPSTRCCSTIATNWWRRPTGTASACCSTTITSATGYAGKALYGTPTSETTANGS